MAAITRWDPVHEFVGLRHTIDRLFDEAFGRTPVSGGINGDDLRPGNLLIDVVETGDDLVVRAAIPGFRPDDVDITVDDDVLTISGEARTESLADGVTYHRREIRTGAFQRQLRLPPTVNPDGAGATFENGMLTLTLPKRPEARARSIKITDKGVVDTSASKS